MDGTISPEEFSRLYELLKAGYKDNELDPVLEKAFSDPQFSVPGAMEDKKDVLAAIHARIQPAPAIPNWRRKWALPAAAALATLLLTTIYLYRVGSTRHTSDMAIKNTAAFDAPPGRNGAILTLANGRQILLDTVNNGLLPEGENTVARKTDGQLEYQSGVTPAPNAAIQYNTISTPRGRQFHVTLSDGTRVWLNAASSIRYPTAFTGSERRVLVSGEALLDVSQSKNAPFIVQLSHGEVQVLGTQFDVADYDDEKTIDATLVQGSIKLKTADQSVMLAPGQQGRIDRNTGKLSSLTADTTTVLAWTKGRLDIDGDLASLMRQIARWYDVDVIYEGRVPNIRIGGIVNRNTSLSAVLDYLGENGLHYSTKGKTITISP